MSGTDPLRALRNVVLTGLAIVLPLAATLYLIWFLIDRLRGVLSPAVDLMEWAGVIAFFRRRALISVLIETGIYTDVSGFLSEVIAISIFLSVIVAVGAIARYQYGEVVVSLFDYFIASIPAIGTVYQTLRQVGNMILSDAAAEFESVKLLEMLSKDTYVIAFQTNPGPDSIAEATDEEEIMTLFVPMAPNPVTGGFLVYVPADRVVDVDLSVDEAVQAILTSGIASENTEVSDSSSIRSAIDPTNDGRFQK